MVFSPPKQFSNIALKAPAGRSWDLMGDLTHSPVSPEVLGCFKAARTTRQGQKCYAELDLSRSIQEVPCVENTLFLVQVLELCALEHSVFDGFERDEGEKEREVLFAEVYHTKGTAAQSWRTG